VRGTDHALSALTSRLNPFFFSWPVDFTLHRWTIKQLCEAALAECGRHEAGLSFTRTYHLHRHLADGGAPADTSLHSLTPDHSVVGGAASLRGEEAEWWKGRLAWADAYTDNLLGGKREAAGALGITLAS
jgi:hypothetical protein